MVFEYFCYAKPHPQSCRQKSLEHYNEKLWKSLAISPSNTNTMTPGTSSSKVFGLGGARPARACTRGVNAVVNATARSLPTACDVLALAFGRGTKASSSDTCSHRLGSWDLKSGSSGGSAVGGEGWWSTSSYAACVGLMPWAEAESCTSSQTETLN